MRYRAFVVHNGRMKYAARLSWGIVIYSVLYLSWHALATYQFTQGIIPRVAEIAVLVAVCTVAGSALKLNSWKDILPYSFFWACTTAVLDAIMTVPFGGLQIYANWNLWIGYAFVVLFPLAAPLTRIYRDDIGSIS